MADKRSTNDCNCPSLKPAELGVKTRDANCNLIRSEVDVRMVVVVTKGGRITPIHIIQEDDHYVPQMDWVIT